MAFKGIESRLDSVRGICLNNPRIVIAGGGNYSEKDKRDMIIKASGTSLAEMTVDNMALVRRGGVRKALEFNYNKEMYKREERYKELLLESRANPDGPRPSVETAMHELLAKYVLHTHPTVLTALSCVAEAKELTKELLGERYLVMDYCDPGILLGTEAKKLLEEWSVIPLGIMQRNHGIFFTSDNFEELIEDHNQAIEKVKTRIYRDRDANELSFGDKIADFGEPDRNALECVMGAIYDAIFKQKSRLILNLYEFIEKGLTPLKMEADNNVLYFNTNDYARKYAESKRAEETAGTFSWLSPDHIVSCGMTDSYIHINDPSDLDRLRRDTQDQIEKVFGSNLYPRIFIIQGMGIVTVGGHHPADKEPEIAARNAMQLANDALYVDAAARALGTIQRLRYENAFFIENWEVEKMRANVMQRK